MRILSNSCGLKGKYNGPAEFASNAAELCTLADKLETWLDCPQDIKWAITKGKLYILQARLTTTLQAGNDGLNIIKTGITIV